MSGATPMEAAERWCPFLARPDDNPARGRCIAVECMAWRWIAGSGGYSGPSMAPSQELPRTHGYCGLVGRQA